MEAILGPPLFAQLAQLARWIRAEELETPAHSPNAVELEVVRSARRGDRSAFARIVDLHKQSVYALAVRMVGAADAADMAQDVFLRAYQRLPSFDARKPLRPWLLGIATHRCIDELRRRRRTNVELLESADAMGMQPEHEPDERIAVREQAEQVNGLLQQLPAQQREALVLFHQEALSYREIASVMDVPLGTVMTWLHRARLTLRQKLEETKLEESP